jgi:hypothetical protein
MTLTSFAHLDYYLSANTARQVVTVTDKKFGFPMVFGSSAIFAPIIGTASVSVIALSNLSC